MIVLDGFLTGLILQIAIGPVFFFILNLILQRSLSLPGSTCPKFALQSFLT